MWSNRRWSVATAGITLVLLAGCGVIESLAEDDGAETRVVADESLAMIIADVEAFWAEQALLVDLEYESVDPNRIFLRSELMDIGPAGCSFDGGTDDLTAGSVEGNAYVITCDEGETIVLDDIEYIPDLRAQYGEVGVAVLVAHEWGHVVQNQLGLVGQTSILAEQQADCYSGAFMAWAEAAERAPFDDPAALDDAVLSTIETADELTVGASDSEAHGNGFDRVRATQEGYDRGVEFCRSYDDSPPPVTQIEFVGANASDNLAFEAADRLLLAEVAAHFADVLTDRTDDRQDASKDTDQLTAQDVDVVNQLAEVVELPDEGFLRDLHELIGDNAVGAQYSLAYGRAVQELVGDPTVGEGPALQRACLMGSWLHEAIEQGPDAQAGALAPGDVDEAMLVYLVSPELDDRPGLVFELLASLRLGTIEGFQACGLGR